MQTRFFLLALALVASVGCKTAAKVITLPGIGVNAKSLERSEYVVLGDAEGKACVEESCILGIFCSTKSDTGATDTVEGRLFTDNVQTSAPSAAAGFPFAAAAGTEGNRTAAEDAALYMAIQSVPDADALLAPRKSMELTTTDNVVMTSQKACVRVFGKGIRLKTDAEIAGGAAPTPTPPPAPPAPPAEAPVPAPTPG